MQEQIAYDNCTKVNEEKRNLYSIYRSSYNAPASSDYNGDDIAIALCNLNTSIFRTSNNGNLKELTR